MNLSDYRKHAETDLKIDQTELDSESIRTPQIHSKYLNFLTDEKIKLTKFEFDLKTMRKKKWLYYTGKMSHEELAEEGWEPFQLSILKSDVDKFIDSDEDVQKIEMKVSYLKTIVDYLESVIKIINNRQWNIRSAIDWLKFTNGQ